jgi:hypothetical protein
MVSYMRQESDDGAASLHGAQGMLMLALRIAVSSARRGEANP